MTPNLHYSAMECKVSTWQVMVHKQRANLWSKLARKANKCLNKKRKRAMMKSLVLKLSSRL